MALYTICYTTIINVFRSGKNSKSNHKAAVYALSSYISKIFQFSDNKRFFYTRQLLDPKNMTRLQFFSEQTLELLVV